MGASFTVLLIVGCSVGNPAPSTRAPDARSVTPAPTVSAPVPTPPPARDLGIAPDLGSAPTPLGAKTGPAGGSVATSTPAGGVPTVEGPATVLRVVEVGVLDVLVAGDVYRVRLAGVGLPQVWGVVACFGEEARTLMEMLAPSGSALILEAASVAEGALPAVYAWSGAMLVNARVVEMGYALVAESGARGLHSAVLIDAERAAARSIAGLWGAAVGIDAYRGGIECESLSGYFSASHVGTASVVRDGVPYGHLR